MIMTLVVNLVRTSAGFTYRLNPRASRSKGPTNCGAHRVNGRYM